MTISHCAPNSHNAFVNHKNTSNSVLVSSSTHISSSPDLDSIKKAFQHSYATLYRSQSLQFCHLACEYKSDSSRWLFGITFEGRILSYNLIFLYEILLSAINIYNFFLFCLQHECHLNLKTYSRILYNTREIGLLSEIYKKQLKHTFDIMIE